jgi:hypothetical protein
MDSVAFVGVVVLIAGTVLVPGLMFAFVPKRVQEWELRQAERHTWWARTERRKKRLGSERYPAVMRIVGVFMVALSLAILVGMTLFPPE